MNCDIGEVTSQLILHPSFASPMSLALHLRHLANRPWFVVKSSNYLSVKFQHPRSTTLGQVVAYAPVMQRARVRSPVGARFLGEVLYGVFPHL